PLHVRVGAVPRAPAAHRRGRDAPAGDGGHGRFHRHLRGHVRAGAGRRRAPRARRVRLVRLREARMNIRKLPLLTLVCAVQPLACLTPPGLRAPDTAASAAAPPRAPEKMAELDAWAAVPLMSP